VHRSVSALVLELNMLFRVKDASLMSFPAKIPSTTKLFCSFFDAFGPDEVTRSNTFVCTVPLHAHIIDFGLLLLLIVH